MAGDWIKVEHSTLDKPEIFVMADQLGIDGDAVVGKCLRFWAWVDNNTVDGRVDVKVTAVRLQVDRLCSCKGFTDALISAGWLKVSDDGMSVEIPNFQYHNSESAKERALKTRRQQKWRDKTKGKSVDDCVDGNASTAASTTASIREEKRREEKNKEKNIRDSDESPECEKTDEQQSRKSKTRLDEFNQVWETLSADWHGNPGSKAEALKAYQKIKPDEETLQAIYAGHLKQIQAHHKLAQAGQFSPKFKHVCRWLTLECWNDIPAEPDHDQEQPAKANGHPYANTRAYQVTLKRAQETGEVQMIEFRGLPTFVSPSGAVS